MNHISILLWCTLSSFVTVVAVFLEEDIYLEHNADRLEENFNSRCVRNWLWSQLSIQQVLLILAM